MLLLKPGCEDVRHAAASHGRHAGVHFRWCDRELHRCRLHDVRQRRHRRRRRAQAAGLVGWHCVEADREAAGARRCRRGDQTKRGPARGMKPEAVADHVTQAPLAYQPGTGRPCRVE